MTSPFLVVIPSIYQPYTDACLRSAHIDPDDLCLIDNTVNNKGVGASWNVGARRVLDEGRDWLVICSAGMRFAKRGIATFTDQLALHPTAQAVEAGCDLGWHLIAIARTTFERIGFFDENFYPGYYEDLDYGLRIRKGFGINYIPGVESWPKVTVAATLTMAAHGIHLGGVTGDGNVLAAYYADKWNGVSGQEKNDLPWGDRPLDWWPERGHELALPRPNWS